jgi:hypothetical protein
VGVTLGSFILHSVLIIVNTLSLLFLVELQLFDSVCFVPVCFLQEHFSLPFVLDGCENWYLTLREEHRLRAFEYSVLRRIFGPKRDEVREEWRKLHSE